MDKIIRTKSQAKGGITNREKIVLKKYANMWIDRIMRTDKIEPKKIIPVIEGLYKISKLKKPKVIIVPSPLVMAIAGGIASMWWKNKKDSATDSATRSATDLATDSATDSTIDSATDLATRSAIDSATDSAIDSATDFEWLIPMIIEFNGKDNVRKTLDEIRNWYYYCQGGNMWGQYDSYLTAMRDVIGLDLPIHKKYKYWEDCAIHGGYRFMHEEFCLVSDFPERIRKNNENNPHNEYGASHRWRDGWELFYLYGVRFEKDEYYKVINSEMSFEEIMKIKDMDKRTVALRYCKPLDLFRSTNSIRVDGNVDIGKGNELWKMPKGDIFDRDEYFLRYFCPSSGREYIKGVMPEDAKRLNYNADSCMARYHHFSVKQYLDPLFLST